MNEASVPAMAAPPPPRDNPLTRSVAGMVGVAFLAVMVTACVGSLWWTLGKTSVLAPQMDSNGRPTGRLELREGTPRYDNQDPRARQLPPTWWGSASGSPDDSTTVAGRIHAVAEHRAMEDLARRNDETVDRLQADGVEPTAEQVRRHRPFYLMGTDILGRDLFVRCLTGGGISLGIGMAAALISVLLGTLYGSVSGYVGGHVDAVMMRVVDVLYGLPYILLVVLLAVAVDAGLGHWQAGRTRAAHEKQQAYVQRMKADLPAAQQDDPKVLEDLHDRARVKYGSGELTASTLRTVNVVTLLVAIGGVSWLTMARVVRGQVLSLKGQPFIEAARAMGVPVRGLFLRHLLPNLLGPIIVYATLTVPQAILQESFLSFLGIGVRPPLPSWGNLAAEGLTELNPYKSHWWLLLFPCLLLGTTLLALNFVGEGLREAFDPKRARR